MSDTPKKRQRIKEEDWTVLIKNVQELLRKGLQLDIACVLFDVSEANENHLLKKLSTMQDGISFATPSKYKVATSQTKLAKIYPNVAKFIIIEQGDTLILKPLTKETAEALRNEVDAEWERKRLEALNLSPEEKELEMSNVQ